MRQPLAGRRILVTRPLAQAGPLVAAIEQQGGQGVVFPLIDIAPADDLLPLADLERLTAIYETLLCRFLAAAEPER